MLLEHEGIQSSELLGEFSLGACSRLWSPDRNKKRCNVFGLFTLCVRNSTDHSSANVEHICPFKLIGRMEENLRAGEVNHLEQGLPWASAAEVAASLESAWGRRLRLITQTSSQQERNSVMFHYIKNIQHLGVASIWASTEGYGVRIVQALLHWESCGLCHECGGCKNKRDVGSVTSADRTGMV